MATIRPGTQSALLVVDVQVGVVAEAADVSRQIGSIALAVSRARDAGAPVIWVQHQQARGALAAGSAAAKKSEFVIYPDAPHAFHADYRPSFRKEAAEDGWKRCLAWFKQHGVA